MADNEDIGIPSPEKKELPALDSDEESFLESDNSLPALEDHIEEFETSSEKKKNVKEEISNFEPPKENLESSEPISETNRIPNIETKLEKAEPKKSFFSRIKDKFSKEEKQIPKPIATEEVSIEKEAIEKLDEIQEEEPISNTELPPEIEGKKISDIIEKVKDKEDEIRKRENILIIKREELKHKSLDLKGMESEINDRLSKLEELEKIIRVKEGELAYKEELIAEKEKQILEIENYVKKIQKRRIKQDVFIEKTAKKLDEKSMFKNFLHENILHNEEIPSIDMEFDNFSQRLDKIQIFNLIDYAYSLLREGNYSKAKTVYSKLRLKFKNTTLDSVEKVQVLTAIKSLYFDLKSYSEGFVTNQ